MDDETIDTGIISVKPEAVKGRLRRNSTGNTISIGSKSLSNSHGKILPRYLRPSMGSCHDLCKYGKKDASKTEGKHHFRRRFRNNSIVQDEVQIEVEHLNLQERRKRPVINKNAFSAAKEIGLLDEHIDIKLVTSSLTQKSIVSAKQAIISASRENELNPASSLNPGDIKKGQLFQQKTRLHRKTISDKSKAVNQNDPSPANEIDAHGKPDFVEKINASLFKKSVASVKPSVSKRKASSLFKKPTPSAKSRNLDQKSTSPLERIHLSVKPAIPLRRKTSVVKPVSVLNPFWAPTCRSKQESKTDKTRGKSKVGGKKVLNPPAASLSPMQKQEKVGKSDHDSDDIKEKNSSVVEAKSEAVELDPIQRNSGTSPLNSHTEEEIMNVSAFGDASESVSEEVEFSFDEGKRRHRRTATVHPVEFFSAPRKLRFRRGKVVDLQPASNVPRILRFRKGRAVRESPNDDREFGTGIFRRDEVDGSVSNDLGSEAQTVVLRHQDTQRKKDSQGLFNHVIEETATKLVETRKSKVKALVGAFEAVISLFKKANRHQQSQLETQ